MKIGDVIRFDVFRWSEAGENLCANRPIWGYIFQAGSTNGKAIVLQGTRKARKGDELYFSTVYDKWEIVSDPNKWPPEVCREIVKKALLDE